MFYISQYEKVNQACLGDERQLGLRVTFTTLIPNIILDNENIQYIRLEEVANSNTENIVMGSTCSNKITIGLIEDPYNKKVSRVGNLSGKKIKVDVDITTDEGVIDCPLGYFYITEIEQIDGSNTIEVIAYDCLCKLSENYTPTVNTDGCKIKDLYNDLKTQIMTYTGQTLKAKELPEGDGWDMIEVQTDQSYLSSLGYVAGMLGGFVRVDRDGEIEIVSCLDQENKWYQPLDFTLDRKHQYFETNSKKTDTPKIITSITSGITDFPVYAGDGTVGCDINFECPYMTTQAIDAIYQKVKGKEFQPCEIRWRGNPLVQAGDQIDTIFCSKNMVDVDTDLFYTSFNTSTIQEFVYDIKTNQWYLENQLANLGNYGITYNYTPKDGDKIEIDFIVREDGNYAKATLYYHEPVYIMKHSLYINGGMSDTIECYGQSEEKAKLSSSYTSASKVIDKLYNNLNEAILNITQNTTGVDGGYVVFHTRGDKCQSSTTIENGSCAVNSATFADMSPLAGLYTYTYSSSGWTYEGNVVDIGSLGISYAGTPKEGDTITVNLSYTSKYPDEILVMDSQSISLAQNVWRFNQNGLAHSPYGYNGPYTTAITQDGTIVGSFIAGQSLSFNKLTTQAVSQITQDLVNQTDFNNFSDSVYTDIQASESKMEQYADDQLDKYKKEVAQYLTFNGEEGLIIGAQNSSFKTNLTNSKLSFTDNNIEVAYISNEEFNITDGKIINKLQIGKFKFVPRTNGNLSLIWEE